MKIRTTLLIASLFAVASVTAQPLTSNEILSAIDGEYNHVEDQIRFDAEERVNFSLSEDDSTVSLNDILSGIDGEYTE